MITLVRSDRAQRPVLAGIALGLAVLLGVAAAVLGLPSLALAAPVFVAVCAVWPAPGVAVLVAACALDRFAVNAGGANLRPDEVAALALAAALIARLLLTHGRIPRIPLLVPILAYWGCNVLATLTAGDDLVRGIGLDLLMLDLIVLYAALASYLSCPARLLQTVRLWLGVAVAEALVGAAAFVLYTRAHGVVPGVQLDPAPPHEPMVYGTLYEGNIFGSYMSAAFLIALALATDETIRRKLPLYLTLAATGLGLLLSATRSAWGATFVSAVVLLWLLRLGPGARLMGRRARLLGRFLAGLIAVGLVVGIGLAVLPANVTGALGTRAHGLLNFTSGSGYGRVQLYKVAIAEWELHPLLGLGPGSFSYRLPGDLSTGPAWLPNLLLQALHDSGVLGLAALIWVFAAFYAVTLRALRRVPAGQERTVLAGLIAAVTALLIAFQLTPGFSLGYTWALLACAAAGAQIVDRRRVAAGHKEADAA